MLETGLNPFQIIKLYSGNCTFILMFLVALIYLWIFEKDNIKKAVLVISSAVFCILFVMPIFEYLFMNRLGEAGTYYRFLWLVPTAIVSSYATFHILDRFKKLFVKIIAIVILLVCICIGGVYMYQAPVFIKGNNPYQIPDYVLDICDEVIIENREVGVVFPDEILQYPRLYSAYIVMPYGFETLQFGTGPNSAIHDEMLKDTIDVKTLAALSEEKGFHYIVLNINKKLDGKFEDNYYEYVGRYGDYDLYKNTRLFFGQWEDFEEWEASHDEEED